MTSRRIVGSLVGNWGRCVNLVGCLNSGDLAGFGVNFYVENGKVSLCVQTSFPVQLMSKLRA